MNKKKMTLKRYPPETAGSMMLLTVPTCSSDDKVREIRQAVLIGAPKMETINYIYVLDKGVLVGVFSLKEVLRRKDEEKAADFMDRMVVRVSPYHDQEKVAILAVRNNLKAIPVVEKSGYFLGVVPSDVILNILHKEHVEDFLLSVGIQKGGDGFSSKVFQSSVGILAKMRLPWLITGLFGGMIAAQITVLFETPLKAHFILAAFIPLIVYMADAVASQTQVLYIRNLTVHCFSHKTYLFKEIRVGLLVATALSSILFFISWAISGTVSIGIILALSLFLTVLAAILVSIAIIQLLLKLGKDPALGSGPFGTIIADISSLVIYFFIASSLLPILTTG